MRVELEMGDMNKIKNSNIKTIIRKVLASFRYLLKFIGPAFIVSVAYVDPGNFATNISGGSMFNYDLIWVILWSNIMAIFLQINSAKLGIATDNNLPQMCRKVFSKKLNWVFWFVAEFASMATTVAEFLGGAMGIYLLFNIPLPAAGILTAVITFFITYMQKYGQKIIEKIITVFIAIICISYSVELFLAKPSWSAVAFHSIVPRISNSSALYIAVGMLGATVMPHVIYLHSELVQYRNKNHDAAHKRNHLHMEKLDVIIAMNIAFIVNAAMVIVSASVFHSRGMAVNTIEQAHKSLEPLLGSLSSGAFAIALLASGFSSSAVGTMAGETVMDGFVNVKISPVIKRIVTMLPAIIIILSGINPMKALVFSQVSLSFALPFAIIPMLIITNRKDIMGEFVNGKYTKAAGIVIASIIIFLNFLLILQM